MTRYKWQPIETAPVDGTMVLLWFPDYDRAALGEARVSDAYGMEIVEWVDDWQNDVYETQDSGNAWPTHWMPLPEPPDGQ